MKTAELRSFVKEILPIITPHVEAILGPIPDYRIKVCDKLNALRGAEVPFNVPDRGLFEFYAAGFYERYERSLHRTGRWQKSEIIFGTGYLLQNLVHDLVHVYQAEHEEYYDDFQNHRRWADGLAEYVAWRVMDNLYTSAKDELRSWFWTKNERSPETWVKAFREGYYKHAIKRALVCYANSHRSDLRYFRVAKYFRVQRLHSDELNDYVQRFLRRKSYRLQFTITPEGKKCCYREQKHKKRYHQIWMRYVLGWNAVIKLIEVDGMPLKELIRTPMNDAELLEAAGLSELKRIPTS